MGKARERHRVPLDFAPEAYKHLKQIRELARARTNVEVFRNVLRVYGWLLARTKQDYYKIQLVKGNAIKEIELLL